MKYYINYVSDSSPYLKTFKTKKAMDKFIKNFTIDLQNGYWIEFAFKGTLYFKSSNRKC